MSALLWGASTKASTSTAPADLVTRGWDALEHDALASTSESSSSPFASAETPRPPRKRSKARLVEEVIPEEYSAEEGRGTDEDSLDGSDIVLRLKRSELSDDQLRLLSAHTRRPRDSPPSGRRAPSTPPPQQQQGSPSRSHQKRKSLTGTVIDATVVTLALGYSAFRVWRAAPEDGIDEEEDETMVEETTPNKRPDPDRARARARMTRPRAESTTSSTVSDEPPPYSEHPGASRRARRPLAIGRSSASASSPAHSRSRTRVPLTEGEEALAASFERVLGFGADRATPPASGSRTQRVRRSVSPELTRESTSSRPGLPTSSSFEFEGDDEFKEFAARLAGLIQTGEAALASGAPTLSRREEEDLMEDEDLSMTTEDGSGGPRRWDSSLSLSRKAQKRTSTSSLASLHGAGGYATPKLLSSVSSSHGRRASTSTSLSTTTSVLPSAFLASTAHAQNLGSRASNASLASLQSRRAAAGRLGGALEEAAADGLELDDGRSERRSSYSGTPGSTVGGGRPSIGGASTTSMARTSLAELWAATSPPPSADGTIQSQQQQQQGQGLGPPAALGMGRRTSAGGYFGQHQPGHGRTTSLSGRSGDRASPTTYLSRGEDFFGPASASTSSALMSPSDSTGTSASGISRSSSSLSVFAQTAGGAPAPSSGNLPASLRFDDSPGWSSPHSPYYSPSSVSASTSVNSNRFFRPPVASATTAVSSSGVVSARSTGGPAVDGTATALEGVIERAKERRAKGWWERD